MGAAKQLEMLRVRLRQSPQKLTQNMLKKLSGRPTKSRSGGGRSRERGADVERASAATKVQWAILRSISRDATGHLKNF